MTNNVKIFFCQCTHRLEEPNTIRTVKLFKDYVDGIIIIEDTLSDNGRQELRNLGADVNTIRWIDKFSWYRNQYVKRVPEGAYLIQMDPDEHPSKPLLEGLRDFVGQMRKENKGVGLIPVQDDFYHKDGTLTSHYTDWYKPLILLRTPNLKYKGEVHESVESDNPEPIKAPFDQRYIHTRFWWKTSRGGVRNDFIAESNRMTREYWNPMRRMFAKYGIHTWYQLDEYYRGGNIAPEIKDWIISGKDKKDHEHKDHFIYYYEWLHSDELPEEIKKTHESIAL